MAETPPARCRAIPLVLIVLGGIAIAWSQLSPNIEGNFRAVFSLLAILLTLLGIGAWVLLLSGMAWGRRFKILGTALLTFVALTFIATKVLRREGSYTGAGVPRFVWRWTPRDVAPPMMPIAAKAVAIDLSATTPDDFPQFLGPDRDAQVRGVHLSRDWASHPPELLWRRKVGAAWSGFAVVGNYAITMEQRDKLESTICYDLPTGEPLWAHGNAAYLRDIEGGDGPRATPTISGGKVYTVGGVGNLDCLDGATGKPIWSQSLFTDPEHQRLHYGQTCSPLIVNNLVIVTGGKDGPALAAFNKDDGKPAWQSPSGTREFSMPAYASPTLATLLGVRQILQVHQRGIAGHDIADGHVLWQFPWPGFMPKNSQPIPVGQDKVYCSTGYGIGSVLLQLRLNGSAIEAHEIWHTPIMKTELSNVIVRDDAAYGFDDGWLVCQDLKTGKKKWRGEKYGHGPLLQAGDLLLVQAEDGNVSLLDVNPSGPTILGSINAVSGSSTCWNTPALAGHRLLIRNEREAACYRLP